MLTKDRKIVISLFCGIGGFDLGFEAAGFEIAVAIDNDPKVLSLYQNNFPNTITLCRDIGSLSASEIKEIITRKYQDWDGEIAAVIGGPPCQGFSVAGKQNLDDERSQLILKFIKLVVELNPSMFVMENVPAIESKKFSHITGNAVALAQEHYTISKWLLTASDYGVPQKRQRAIWVGCSENVSLNQKRYEYQTNILDELAIPDKSNQKFTVKDAISDLSNIPINSQTDVWEINHKGEYARYLEDVFHSQSERQKSSSNISGLRATVHKVETQQKYAATIPGEKEPTTWCYKLTEEGFSPTLRAGSGNRTAARPIHYQQPRVITVREAARLHSYPDWFEFGESKLAAHKAIGNSVPPLLAYAIAQTLIPYIEQNHTEVDLSSLRDATRIAMVRSKRSKAIAISSIKVQKVIREKIKTQLNKYLYLQCLHPFSTEIIEKCCSKTYLLPTSKIINNRAPPKSKIINNDI
ncbi:MAG: DNA cytosine methyltransferase [Cyanobacteria bacterium P01_A01_bin.45]